MRLATYRHPGSDLDRVGFSTLFFMGNARCIVELIVGGLCDRYPELKFVSVESGFGYG